MTGEHHDKGAGPSVRNGTHSEEHLHNAQPSSSGPNGPPPLSFSFAQQGYKASPVAEFARHLPTPKLQRPPAFPPGTSHVGGGGNNPSPHVRSGGIPTQSPAPYMVQVPRATAFGAQKRRLTTVPQSPTPLSANPRNGLLGATPSRQLPQFGGPLSISLPFQDDMPIEHRPQRPRTAGPLSEENDAEMVEEAFQDDNPYPRRPKTSPPAHVDEAGDAPAGGEFDSSNSKRGMPFNHHMKQDLFGQRRGHDFGGHTSGPFHEGTQSDLAGPFNNGHSNHQAMRSIHPDNGQKQQTMEQDQQHRSHEPQPNLGHQHQQSFASDHHFSNERQSMTPSAKTRPPQPLNNSLLEAARQLDMNTEKIEQLESHIADLNAHADSIEKDNAQLREHLQAAQKQTEEIKASKDGTVKMARDRFKELSEKFAETHGSLNNLRQTFHHQQAASLADLKEAIKAKDGMARELETCRTTLTTAVEVATSSAHAALDDLKAVQEERETVVKEKNGEIKALRLALENEESHNKQLAALHDTVTGAFGGDITAFGSNLATVAGSGLLSANVITTLQDQIGQYRSELNKANERREEALLTIENLRQEFKDLESAHEEARESLIAQVSEQTAAIASIVAENKLASMDASNEIDCLKAVNKALEEKSDILTAKHARLEGKMKDAALSHREAVAVARTETIAIQATLEKEERDAKEYKKAAEYKFESYQREIQTLKDTITEAAHTEKVAQALAAERTTVLTEAKSELGTARKSIQRLEKDISKLEQQLASSQDTCKLLQNEVVTVQKDLDTAHESAKATHDMSAKSQELQKKISDQAARLKDKDSHIATLETLVKAKNDAADTLASQLKEINDSAVDEAVARDAEIQDLRRQLDKKSTEQNAAALHYAAEEAKLIDELKKKEQQRLGLQRSLDQVTASVPAGTSLTRYQRGEMVASDKEFLQAIELSFQKTITERENQIHELQNKVRKLEEARKTVTMTRVSVPPRVVIQAPLSSPLSDPEGTNVARTTAPAPPVPGKRKLVELDSNTDVVDEILGDGFDGDMDLYTAGPSKPKPKPPTGAADVTKGASSSAPPSSPKAQPNPKAQPKKSALKKTTGAKKPNAATTTTTRRQSVRLSSLPIRDSASPAPPALKFNISSASVSASTPAAQLPTTLLPPYIASNAPASGSSGGGGAGSSAIASANAAATAAANQAASSSTPDSGSGAGGTGTHPPPASQNPKRKKVVNTY